MKIRMLHGQQSEFVACVYMNNCLLHQHLLCRNVTYQFSCQNKVLTNFSYYLLHIPLSLIIISRTSLTDVYSHHDAIRAIRMCAIVSITFNRIATEFNLPFGGYGILGMCNDSATLIDFALRGETNAYPLLSTGRYLNHIVAYLIKMKNELSEKSADGTNLQPALDDILCLIKSTSHLPSDLHISPATLIGTSARYSASYGVPVFQSTADAKAVLREMADMAREFLE